ETEIERHPPDETSAKSQPEVEFHRDDQYEGRHIKDDGTEFNFLPQQ
ncbi:7602_t:CDS:1, partial [Funneliformis caledonium]